MGSPPPKQMSAKADAQEKVRHRRLMPSTMGAAFAAAAANTAAGTGNNGPVLTLRLLLLSMMRSVINAGWPNAAGLKPVMRMPSCARNGTQVSHKQPGGPTVNGPPGT